MPPDPTLPPPGWYPDPYEMGSQRWFDGSEWTTHAVASDSDRLVEPDWVHLTDDKLQRDGRFSSNDLSHPHVDEPTFGGGWQGRYGNRVGRATMRAGTRWGPVRASRWLGGLTLVLAICAWGDPAHRVFLAPAAAVSLVATVVLSVREARDRAYWRKVGRHD